MTAAERRRIAEMVDAAVRARLASARYCDGCARWLELGEFGRSRQCRACRSTFNAFAYERRVAA